MANYLFIGAHIDDVELCCSGTISKLKEHGHHIEIVCLSQNYEGINLKYEWDESMRDLKPNICSIFDFNTREFSKSRNEILQILFKFKPDVVFTHSPYCWHADHMTVGRESLRAFKHSTIVTYQQEWNQRKFVKNYFIKLEDRHLNKKLDVLKNFHSQKDKPYFNQDFIVSSMTVNGLMCGHRYAEAFQVINFIA